MKPVIQGAIWLTVIAAGTAQAASYTQTLNFETTERQSSWNEGEAFVEQGTEFLGFTWNKSQTYSGSGTTTVQVPNEPEYTAAVLAGCGPNNIFGLKCPPATKAVTYTGTGSTTWSTSGRLGLEFSYVIDAGSVAADLDFSVGADAPLTVDAGVAIDLGTFSTLDAGSLDGRTPTIQMDINQVTDINATISATSTVPNKSTGVKETVSGSATLIDVDENISLVDADLNSIVWMQGVVDEINEIQNLVEVQALETALLENSVGWAGDLATLGLAYELDEDGNYRTVYDGGSGVLPSLALDMAQFEFSFPTSEDRTDAITNGSLNLRQQDDFVDLTLDLDGIASMASGGTGGIWGVGADIGPLTISGDIMDADLRGGMDVFQEFDLTPTLKAEVLFSSTVSIGGVLVDNWSGIWEDLPEIVFLEDTEILPIFSVDAMFDSLLGLNFDMEMNVDFFKLAADLKIYGVDIFGATLGPLININNGSNLGDVTVRDTSFLLGGFKDLVGESFWVDVNDGVTVDRTTTNFASYFGGPTEVPVPPALPLLGAGVLALWGLRRRG